MIPTRKIIHISCFVTLIAVCSTLGVNYSKAQTPLDEDITVIAPYEPIIREAEKINIQPRIEEVTRQLPKMDISITPQKLSVSLPTEIQEAAIPPAATPAMLFRNLISAGFGNYTTPFLQFVANTKHNPRFSASLQLRHLSSHGQIRNYGYSGYSDNSASIAGRIIGKRQTIGASLHYDRNTLHHYGFLADSFPTPLWDLSKENIMQRFHTAGGNVAIESNAGHNRFRFNTRAGYRYFADRFSTTEHNAAVQLGATLPVRLFGGVDKQDLSAALTFANFSTIDSVETRNNLVAGLQPQFAIRYNEYELKVGLLLSVASDTSATVHVFPHAEAKLHVVKNRFTILAGIGGQVEQNSFHSLAQSNPFVASRLELYNSIEKFRFYGGISATPLNRLNLRIELANSVKNNMPLFINDTIAPGNRFLVLYDNMNIVRGSMELTYELTDILSIRAGGNYFVFTPDTQDKAWHRPDYDLFLEGRYSFLERWTVSSRFRLMGPSYAKMYQNGQPQQVQVKGWADLSAHATYQFNNQLHFFLAGNNLTGHRQFYWNQFPSQGINLIIGAGFSF